MKNVLITREIGWNTGLSQSMMIVLDMSIFIAVLSFAAYRLYKRITLWRIGKHENRMNRFGRRIWSAIVHGLFQKSILKEPYPGLLHTMLFGGFVVLFIGTVLIFIQEYLTQPIFNWRFFQGGFYLFYSSLMDLFGLLALAAVVLFAVRRYIQRPQRLDNKPEDVFALILLFLVLTTGFFVEAARLAVNAPEYEKWSFVGWAMSAILPKSEGFHRAMWWLHLIMAVWFMLAILSTRFIHIIVSWANQFFRNLDDGTRGAIRPIPAEEFETAESFGIAKIEDLTWKQIFDSDACTRCGRCQDACPATQTNKPLSPKKLMQGIKTHWLEVAPGIAAAGKRSVPGDGFSETLPETKSLKQLNGEVITQDENWACTNCRACVEKCPVFIEHVDIITGLRQNLVMVKGNFPRELREMFRNLETQGNPWGIGAHMRSDWAKEMDVPLISETPDAKILYYVGCAGAFENRNQKVTKAFVKILNAAGVKFAILGEEEQCCGDTARRAGNEYLFQMMARANIELFNKYNVNIIVTTCPHGFHTLKKEYPALGGKYEVYHHTEFILKLIEDGSLKVNPVRNRGTLTYHDSCFLGRYNDNYESARAVMDNLGISIIEMKQNRNSSFCCGAGGARMWLEEDKDKRVNIARTKQTLETNADEIATSCPYCLTMLQDSLDELDPGKKCSDIAELVKAALNE